MEDTVSAETWRTCKVCFPVSDGGWEGWLVCLGSTTRVMCICQSLELLKSSLVL